MHLYYFSVVFFNLTFQDTVLIYVDTPSPLIQKAHHTLHLSYVLGGMWARSSHLPPFLPLLNSTQSHDHLIILYFRPSLSFTETSTDGVAQTPLITGPHANNSLSFWDLLSVTLSVSLYSFPSQLPIYTYKHVKTHEGGVLNELVNEAANL